MKIGNKLVDGIWHPIYDDKEINIGIPNKDNKPFLKVKAGYYPSPCMDITYWETPTTFAVVKKKNLNDERQNNSPHSLYYFCNKCKTGLIFSGIGDHQNERNRSCYCKKCNEDYIFNIDTYELK